MPDTIGLAIGRYHLIAPLGQGGMAVVYRAFDTNLERDVAVKVIRRESFSPDALETVLRRFEREAKTLARLTHPNIVSVIDFGDYNGAPYLVMPYLPGGTLKQHLGQPLHPLQAARLLAPIADALAYAHSQGVIHRDVKPANILITQSGKPLLTDFGIARLLEAGGGHTLTGTGVGIGTPEYMAPEQGMGREIDGRADVYALGVVFYELIAGRKPYEADTPMAVVLKHLTEPLPRPRDFNPVVSEAAERLIYKALAKDPAGRYQNMAEMEAALERLAEGRESQTAPEADDWVDQTGALTVELGTGQKPPAEPTRSTLEVPAPPPARPAAPAPALKVPTFEAPTPPLPAPRRSPTPWLALAALAGIAILVFAIIKVVGPTAAVATEAPAVAVEIPSATEAPAATEPPPIQYSVQAGETCASIAAFYGVTIQDLIVLNDLAPDCALQTGQVLLLPAWAAPMATEAPAEPTPTADGVPIPTNEVITENNLDRLGMLRGLVGSESQYELAVSPDGSMVIYSSNENPVQVRSTVNGELVTQLDASQSFSHAVFLPDGATVLLTHWRKAPRLLDARSGIVMGELSGMDGASPAAVSPGGDQAVFGPRGHLYFYDTSTWQPIAQVDAYYTSSDLAFSPDGRLLARASWDNTVRVWEMATYSLRYTNSGPSPMTSVAFSSDGRYLAAGSSDAKIRVYEASSGKLAYTIDTGQPVLSLAASPQGNFFVSGGDNGVIHFWSFNGGSWLTSREVGGEVVNLEFSANGRILVSGSNGGAVNILGIP